MKTYKPWILILLAWIIVCNQGTAQSAESYSALHESFKTPDYAEWGEVPLWWWEADSLNKERVSWQLETLAAKGVKSVCPIQRSPARSFPESFSYEWWEMVEYVHSECERLGMQLWLYDQVGYGQYGWLEKAAAQVGETGTSQIKFYTVTEKNGEEIKLKLENGKLLDARAYPLTDNIACDEKSVDIKAHVSNNQLSWTPPNGEAWKVAVSVAIPYRSFYLNEASADIFIQQLYQKIEDVVGARSMGNSLAGVFQDEHPPTPRDIYNEQLADTFRVMFGYDISRAIPALYFDLGPKTPKYRVDYFDAYLALVEKTYWKKVYDWTHEKKLLTSHDNWGRKNIYRHSEGYIDYFRSQRWFSAPGFDDAGQRSMLDRNYYDTKIAASIARLYQRPRVWNEGFHSSGWGRTTNQTLSWLAATYAFGANLYDEHGLYYSLNTSTWEHAAPDPHWNQPYWQYYHKISDWVARASYLMSQGQSVVDVAVNYPVTSLLADMEKNDIDYNGYMKVSRMIYDAGIDNDIIDDQSIMQGIVENGLLKIRGNQYQALVFGPQKNMRISVLKQALKLARDGGTVIFYGQLPTASIENGRDDPKLKIVFEELLKSSFNGRESKRITAMHQNGGYAAFLPDEIALIPSFLSANIDRDFIGTGANVFYTHRKTGENHIYFIQNAEDKPVQLNARLRADGVPEIWDAFTGEVQELEQFERKDGYTQLQLLLEGNTGSFIILNPNKSALKKDPQFADRWQNKEIDDYWDFSVIPTRNNQWGDFKWPPSNEKIGPEIRSFRYKEENGVDGIAQEWNLPGFNDLDWETVCYDQGPYWLVAEDIPAKADVLPALLKTQETIEAGTEITIDGNKYPWDEITFSQKTGTGAPAPWGGHSGYPDGHYNKNFIKLKDGRKILFTRIYSPKEQQAGLNVQLRNHTPGLWVNGKKQAFTGSVGNLPLKKGYNNVLLDVPDGSEGMLYVQKEPPAIATNDGETAHMAAPDLKKSDWIWVGNSEGAYFRKTFQLKQLPKNASVVVTGVSGFKLYINGKKVTEDIGPWASWQYPKSMDISPWLKQGENLVAAWGQFLKGMNVSFPAEYQGFILAIKSVNEDGTAVEVNSNASWKGNTEEMKDWFLPEFDAENWPNAEVKGKAGDAPWGSDFLENAGSSTTPYRPLSVNLETPLLEVFDEMPGIAYDIKSESDDRWAWYRFEAPPGLKELTLPMNEARTWINGREIKAMNGVVRIQNPPIGTSTVAIRLKMNRGQYAGAAFEEALKLKLQGGKIKAGPWQDYALPTYSGIGSYQQSINFSEQEAKREIVLDLGEVCVAAEVFINDKSAGIKVASPFQYNISSLIRKGENKIEVRVANTLAPHFSFPRRTINLGPVKSGLIGPVTVKMSPDFACTHKTADKEKLSLELEYLNLAAKRENTHVWGSSPVMGPDGRVHIYAAQWERPEEDRFGGKTPDGKTTGWTQSSEIAHYVADNPEGPFEFIRLAVPDQDGNFNAPHNPTIKYMDGKYVLLFIVNENGNGATQRIMMYVAEYLDDNWRPAEGAEPDGTILRRSDDPKNWDHTARLGNSNPCLIQHDGKYKLYFKAVIPLPDSIEGQEWQRGYTWTYGVALSENLEGPYIKEPERITKSYSPIEDAYVFSYNNRVWMFSRDMNEERGGGGLLWVSEDGMEFDYEKTSIGFYHLDHYIGEEEAGKGIAYRGTNHGHLERPQVLFIDDKPAYLYLATGLGLPKPYGSCSYVFRMRFK